MTFPASLRQPAPSVTLAFGCVVIVGTLLLMLPISRTGDSPADVMVAAFTTVSAVCVTGLITVDTASYWTPFGQGIILVLIHIGGLGVMAMATLLTLTVRGRLGLRSTMVAQAETHTMALGDVRRVLVRVVVMMAIVESVVAVVLVLRFKLAYDQSWPQALWNGIFHSGSGFNNAGFVLFSDGLIGFVADPFIILPICAAVILGGIGFPVLRELRHRWRRPSIWTLHSRITVWGSVVLVAVGSVPFWAFEATSGGTLDGMGVSGQIFGSFAGGVFPRTAGFNSVDYEVIKDETEAITLGLMLIGGGSAGTAGGIKVGTFVILGFVIWSEIRGEQDVTIRGRRISGPVQRQALTVTLLALALVFISIVAMMAVTDLPAIDISFEVVSAFATVGLSTGITADLPPTGQIMLMALMFIGRVGSITVASAIALNTRHRHYRLPEERPIVG